MRRPACGADVPCVCLRSFALLPPQSDEVALSPSVKAAHCLCETLASSAYEFIKRYLTAAIARRTVDVAANSVYVAARNLVFGLILLSRSRLGCASSEIQNLACDRRRGDVQQEA